MPNQPRADNPCRQVRVPDELWHAAQTQAAKDGTNLSVVIRTLLREWLESEDA